MTGSWFPALKARVLIAGKNAHAGSEGTITNSPGKVFNGWTVRLDNGNYVGVAEHDLRAADSQEASA